MNDETIEQDEAIKADESELEVETPTTEELPEQEEASEEVDTESTDEEETDGTPDKPARKTARSRIQELVAEKKQAQSNVEVERQRADSLAKQMADLTRGFKPQSMPQVQEPASGNGELTYEELMQRQDALIQMRMAQAENLNRINNESVEVIGSYPELNPDSDAFNEKLSQSVSKATLAYVQANPTASVKDFVRDYMEPYRDAVEKQSVGQREALAKQASGRAMRPTQVQDQEKPFSELSLDEMEKKLGVVHH